MGEWLTAQSKGTLRFAFETSKGGGSGEGGGVTLPSAAKQIKREGVLILSKAEQDDLSSGKAELTD